MAEIIKMPKLSDTMEEGVVATWHKQVGDSVEDGELLADIETDKATMEFESFQSGTILYHGVKEGEAAPVESILAIVGDKGEDFSALLDSSNASTPESSPAAESKEEAVLEKTSAPAAVDASDVKAVIVKMPKLSDTMTEGTVAAWVKNIGDSVESGEILAEIETDKATMEFESFEDGILLYQGVKEGESAEVDAILGVIGEKGADYQKLIDAFGSNAEILEKEEAPAKKETASSPAPITSAAPVAKAATNSSGRIKISPLAQRLAKEKSIDVSTIAGSGDGGRIIKRDIESYQPVAASAKASIATVFAGEESYEDLPVTQMRKVIAKRLAESKYAAPHFYLTIDIDMDQAIAARKAINELPDVKVSFNDLVIKSAAAALKKHPAINSSWLVDKIRTYNYVHIGVAVAVEEGLVVPVVKNADKKQLSSITAEVRDFAGRAREKKIQPNEMEGSTFSISNLGMFGIEEFTAIINPPNACIMAIGAIRQEPVVKDGQIVVGNRMKVTLSCDHRVVDGAKGSEFLNTFKTYLQNPVTILG
jgi:pyruvate dehydrogenase E2 component (dihydrolipoamide acetyltransferase)